MRPTTDQYASLSRILINADGQTLMALLMSEKQAVLNELMNCSDVAEMPRIQGRAQMLDEILNHFDRAPSLRKTKVDIGPVI